jgi:hypothetical protein
VDENGRTIRWDPRLAKVRQVNVFHREERDLAPGDRIQWRLVNKELELKNAERGTVVSLNGAFATIRWDRGDRQQEVDLAGHKTWDHGYAETVYSAQSKTYARVYVLAPVNSALVTGQNFYTAVTRARLGVKLWTEDPQRLIDKLERFSGEKTSALEGLDRLERDSRDNLAQRHAPVIGRMRIQQEGERSQRRDILLSRYLDERIPHQGPAQRIAIRAKSLAEALDGFLARMLAEGSREQPTVEMIRNTHIAKEDRDHETRTDRGR